MTTEQKIELSSFVCNLLYGYVCFWSLRFFFQRFIFIIYFVSQIKANKKKIMLNLPQPKNAE